MSKGELWGFLLKHGCWGTTGYVPGHVYPSLSGAWRMLCQCSLKYRAKSAFAFIYCSSSCHPELVLSDQASTYSGIFFPTAAYWGESYQTQAPSLLLASPLAASVLWDGAATSWLITLTGFDFYFFFLMSFCNGFSSHLFFWQLDYPMTMNFSLLCEIFVLVMLP